MKIPVLHFSQSSQADRPLHAGVHRVARMLDGSVRVDESPGGVALAQFCVDRRGMWLQVADDARGVHVNGRPVRRMALLRAGDAVYVEGVEMRVCVAPDPAEAPSSASRPPRSAPSAVIDPCTVLRGVGGHHHGRCYSLDVPRLLGSADDADIRIEHEAAIAPHHARIERHGERLWLHGLDPALGMMVNGLAVREAWLEAGDQVVLGVQHRFVVEVPSQPVAEVDPNGGQASGREEGRAASPSPGRKASVRRWPWLLLAALLLGATLNALLWFGVG